jgi:hypothetical protein
MIHPAHTKNILAAIQSYMKEEAAISCKGLLKFFLI